MKVELIKQIFIDDFGYTSYKFKPFKWCCEKLENNEIIDLVNEYDKDDDSSYKPFPMMAIRQDVHYWEWGEEYNDEIYYRITCCPFCHKPIEIVVVGQEDVSEIFSKLKEERDKTWKKYCKTDSKKKEAELRKVVSELDDKINYFYNLVEYKKLEEI